MGFGGAIISLLISKPMAKWSTGAQVINDSPDATHQWIVTTVERFADKAGIQMPEVAIFEGEPNAFATGAFKNSALVAVSTGLLQGMNREEVEAVIGHEVAHVANGDMVTMTLIQGVMNTFVVFLSRVIGYFVDRVVLRNDSDGPGIGYYVTTIVLDIVLGVLAAIIVAWFSRQREFRADRGSADLMGRPQPMMNALARLGGLPPGELPKTVQDDGHHWHAERVDGAVLEPPADRGAHRGAAAAGAALSGRAGCGASGSRRGRGGLGERRAFLAALWLATSASCISRATIRRITW